MKNTITFKKTNPDSEVASYKLYRSTNKDDLFAIENLIATITDFAGKDVVTLDDTAAEFDTVYYYGMEVVTNLGDSILSAPVFHSVVKNTGCVGRDILVGDTEAGFVSSSTTTDIGAGIYFRNIVNKCINLAAESMNSAANTSETSVGGVGSMRLYYNGKPGIYYPSGLIRISSHGTSMSTIDLVKKALSLHSADETTLMYEGYEYKSRFMTVAEWNLFFSKMFSGYLKSANQTGAQSVVPATVESYFSAPTENIMLLRGDGEPGVYQINHATGTLGAYTSGQQVHFPFVLNIKD